MQKLEKPPPPTISNNYKGVTTDEFVYYVQPWKLDSDERGHYCGPKIGVKKKGTNATKSKFKLQMEKIWFKYRKDKHHLIDYLKAL